MTIFCEQHPTEPAHWTCSDCGSSFCPDCVLKRDAGDYVLGKIIHMCPKCVIPAEWIGAANTIVPFWNRLPKFFTYPLHPIPLLFNIGVCIMLLIASLLPLVKIIFILLLVGSVIKYSFSVLFRTAQGNMKPPSFTAGTVSESLKPVFKLLLLYFIGLIWTVIIIKYTGKAPGTLFWITFENLLLPAMIMILVATESVFHAVNPNLFIRLIFRIGKGYFAMCALLALLGAAPFVLLNLLMKIIPVGFNVFLFAFLLIYYRILSYHLMGYVLLQYNQEVGYEVDYDEFQNMSGNSKPEIPDPEAGLLTQINFMSREGKLDEAITLIKESTNTNDISNIKLSEQYYKLLKMKKMYPQMADHAVSYLHMLVRDKEKKKACDVFLECLSVDKEFTSAPVNIFAVAGWLYETGKVKEAMAAYNRIIKLYPGDNLVPNAYFRIAQIYHDRLMDTAKAKKILNAIIKKFPDHDIVQQAGNYLSTLPG